jgi:hypothetical protein
MKKATKIEKACALCGNLFFTTNCKRGSARIYCSRACSDKRSRDKNQTPCAVCGSMFPKKASHADKSVWGVCCSKACSSINRSKMTSGEQNHQHGRRGPERGRAWKGGKRISSWGYVLVGVGVNQYEFEHRLVMEQKLGRKLGRREHVHHINGIKTDNRPENLEILTKEEHTRLHNFADPMPRDPSTQRFIPREQPHA